MGIPSYRQPPRKFEPRKRRTLRQYHAIWQRARLRTERLVGHTWAVMQEIYDTVTPNAQGERVVYGEDPRGSMMYAIAKKPDSKYLSFTRSNNNIGMSSRKRIIDAILDHYLDDDALALGQRLSDSERASDTNMHVVAFEWFFHMLKQKLKQDCRKLTDMPYDQSFLVYVTIQRKKYCVSVKRYYHEYEFTWLGEENTIIFNY